MTPEEVLYSGDVTSITVKTASGSEGFLPGHMWCCKLLAPEGTVRLRDASGLKTGHLSGGYIEVRDDILVFCDKGSMD